MSQNRATKFGRAYALARYTVELGTVVVVLALLVALVSGAGKDPEVYAPLAWYFGMMGVVGGATQLPNVMERVPGKRSAYKPAKAPPLQRRSPVPESDSLDD